MLGERTREREKEGEGGGETIHNSAEIKRVHTQIERTQHASSVVKT